MRRREREIDREREARPYIVMVLGCAIDRAIEHALELVIVNMFDIFVSVLNGVKWCVQVRWMWGYTVRT